MRRLLFKAGIYLNKYGNIELFYLFLWVALPQKPTSIGMLVQPITFTMKSCYPRGGNERLLLAIKEYFP